MYDETFNPNRNFDQVVESQLRSLNIPISPTTTSIMSDFLRKLLKDLHDRFDVYYNFKDLY